MALNPAGIEVPASTDVFDPDGDMRDMGTSLAPRVVVTVANVAARTAYASSRTPSASSPLLVYRANAPVGRKHEISEDGTNWRTLESVTEWTDWSPTFSAAVEGEVVLEAKYRIVGKQVEGRLMMYLTNVSGGAFEVNSSSLPVAPALSAGVSNLLRAIGSAVVNDPASITATVYGGSAVMNQDNGQIYVAGHAGVWRNTSPLTWKLGVRLTMQFTYPIA